MALDSDRRFLLSELRLAPLVLLRASPAVAQPTTMPDMA